MLRILAVTIVCCVIAFEIFAQFFFQRTLGEGTTSLGMYRYDPKLGWTLNDGAFPQETEEFKVVYSTTGSHRATPASKNCNHTDIYVFGDSFVFGVGAKDNDTIPNKLAELSGLCVSNEGVSGYGPDQYFLRWKGEEKPAQKNIFVIFTGNDYKDILAKSDSGNARKKPYLMEDEERMSFVFPPPYQVKTDTGFRLRSDDLVRYIAKQSPAMIRLRSSIVSADTDVVEEAMRRFAFLYGPMDRDSVSFVILPSASLVKGISVSTEEGLFRRQLAAFLQRKGARYADLYERGVMHADDYYPTEGHTTPEANERIAREMMQLISG